MQVEQPTFAPHINRISNKLDARAKEFEAAGQTRPERWEILYGLNARYKNELEQRRQQCATERAEKESCSFRPHLISQDLSLDSETCNVEVRTNVWNQRREEKVKAMKRQGKEREMDECTFKPQLQTQRTLPLCKENVETGCGVAFPKSARQSNNSKVNHTLKQYGPSTTKKKTEDECTKELNNNRRSARPETAARVDENADFRGAMDALHQNLMSMNL